MGDDTSSKQRGFRIGIDDYMVKPIDLDELFLRIGVLLRRAKIAASRKLEVGNFRMDADEHTAYLNDEEIPMTNREFSILYKLLSYPKKTFTRTQYFPMPFSLHKLAEISVESTLGKGTTFTVKIRRV